MTHFDDNAVCPVCGSILLRVKFERVEHEVATQSVGPNHQSTARTVVRWHKLEVFYCRFELESVGERTENVAVCSNATEVALSLKARMNDV